MRAHINQYVFSPLFWVMAILLVTLFLLVVLLFTPLGPKAIAYAANASIKELSVNGVKGSILSGLSIDQFSWEGESGILFKDININIKQYEIENKKILADKLSVGQISIVVPDGNEKPSADSISLPNFGLPINLDANAISLNSFQILKKIPKDVNSQTLVFQIKDIQLERVNINDGFLDFAQLKGDPIILDQPLKIQLLDGRLNMNHPHNLKTSGDIRFSHPQIGDLNGDVSLDGTLTQYQFSSDLRHKEKTMGEQLISFEGVGDYKKVNFEKVKLNSQHGEAIAEGDVFWDPEIRWQFNVEGNDVDTEKLLPEYVVRADTKFRYTGSYLDSRLENQVDIHSVEGVFRDYELKGSGLITEREGLIRAEKFQLEVGDNTFSMDGAVTEPMNLSVKIEASNLQQLVPELAGNINGTADIRGTYKKPEIQTKFIAQKLAFGEFVQNKEDIVAEAELGLEGDVLNLKELKLATGNNQLTAKGKASEPFRINWEINAQKLSLIDPNISGSVVGNGVLEGLTQSPKLTLKVRTKNIAYKELRQGDHPLLLEGLIEKEQEILNVKNLVAKSGKNSVTLNGTASDPLALKLQIRAENLSQVSPDLSGRILGDAQVSGKYASPTIKTNLTASNMRFKDTQLGQTEMYVKGDVQLVEGIPLVKEMDAQIGQNKIKVSGRASSPFDLQWNIKGENLKQISSELSGQLVANGKLQGTIDNPVLNGTIIANALAFQKSTLGQADFTASTNGGIYKIKGNIKNFKHSNQIVDSADLDINGRIESHTINAVINHEKGKLNLKANGGWLNPNWRGVVQSLKLNQSETGDWSLQNPTKLTLSNSAFNIDKFCLNNKKTVSCSTVAWNKNNGISAKGTLDETPLELLEPFLSENITLNGSVNGSYDIRQNNGKPSGSIKFKLPKSSFSFKDSDDESRMFAYEAAEITAKINNRTIDTQTSMTIVNRGNFSAKAKIKLSPENNKHTIDGNAQFDIPNIHFAQELIPRSRGLQGALNSKVTFSGLLNKPKIKGQAEIKNGYLRLPEAGTELTNINIKVAADKPDKAKIKGSMKMGSGLLSLSGDLNIKDLAKWSAKVKLSGKNIRFMNTNEIKATMSPDLLVNVSPDVVRLEGSVIIPQADIRLKELPETSIDESKDTFVVGERKPGDQVSAVKVQPNVKIQLGENVRLDAFGLRAKLAGDVNVTHNKRDILANGSLRVSNGRFEAYGQDLSIDNGRLIFNGSPKLVGMDIRATRTIDKQVVGVHLGGTLLSPKSKIFSDPTLPESEALSFLLTGHSLSSTSGQESALLMSAVRGLGISGSGSLVQKIGSSFGLDDVNIVTNEDLKKSELALGKRLGSKLYVRYLVGLFDQTQKIAIEYKINEVLSLEAQTSSEDYGLDFIYEIERD